MWKGRSAWTLFSLLTFVSAAEDTKKSGVTKAQGPPPFFLQDPSDSLCLAGGEFKRCSIDSLFFVVGTPGELQSPCLDLCVGMFFVKSIGSY